MPNTVTRTSSRADHPGRIAPTFPLSAADKAAHRAAEYRRGDSAPHMDEALRRVTAAVARIEADRQETIRQQIEAAYAEYNDQPNTEYREYLGSAA